MALQPGIILGGQGVNALGAIAAGNEAAARQQEFQRTRDYNAMLQQNGAGIVGGDMNALNALAAYDPMAALNVQATKQDMAFREEDMAMRREKSKLEAQQWLVEQSANLSKAQLEAEAAQMEAALSGAAFFYQKQDRAGYDAFLQSKGINPAEYPFEQFPAHAAEFGGVLDAMKTFAPPEPPKPADDYQRYVQEEQAAGRAPLTRLEFEQAKKGKGMSYTTTAPDGTQTTFTMGGPATSGEPTVGQVYNPNEIESVVGLIDNIAQDPNLGSVVGNKAVLLGGGNMVGDLNLAQRIGYGQGGIAVIEKIGQLQSNAWLSARQMLKGGGAITDYESRKAEAAVARLERPKSEADFKAALQELRDAIVEGAAKLEAAQGVSAPQPSAPMIIDGFQIEEIQ